MWHHWVLLGAHRHSSSSKIGRALRTALVFELIAWRAIALGVHELDLNAGPKALWYQHSARRHEADSARRRAVKGGTA
eukprot:3801759-Pleurochrysis_carterae.AAC.1